MEGEIIDLEPKETDDFSLSESLLALSKLPLLLLQQGSEGGWGGGFNGFAYNNTLCKKVFLCATVAAVATRAVCHYQCE